MAYRSYYKTPKRTRTRTQTPLNSELKNLQEELQELQTRIIPRRQNINYFELDNFLTNKILLIGGSILLGIGIAYLIFNLNRRRCE